MSSRVNFFQIVTFATDPLHGNPAFVLSGAAGLSDHALATACAILRADVAAVVGEPSGDGTSLRFFAPEGPHAGAGHATLAAAHTVLRDKSNAASGGLSCSITFYLPDGDSRTAHLEGDRICVDFPVMPASRVDRLADMEAALERARARLGSRRSAMPRSSTTPLSSPKCSPIWRGYRPSTVPQ